MSSLRSGTRGKRTRWRFTEEFQAGALGLVLDEGKTVGAVTRDLDLRPPAPRLLVARARVDRTKG